MPDRTVLEQLYGGLVVSCQANADSPLRDPFIISRLALAAQQGGAAGLRIQGFEDVRAVRAVTPLPLIGLTKTSREDTEVYITPTVAEAAQLAELGADIVAMDATRRPRPEPLEQLIMAVHAAGALVMADISTLDEAHSALQLGADIVSTTLSGYTSYSPASSTPDWALMQALAEAGLPFVAEGRLNTPADAAHAYRCGAAFVVVGSAITRPDVVTRWFTEALRG
ncbi:N-acetylmannosamine-6-phosphate 2-epimerase [Deinococcus hohokamensis]|uniref:Putative N-acetylmannosamine-6-phosphate 2-epimerase n=1 Tax=Deinococcus hohokamensis TaxID=309883 RepID=A0ABV9I9Y4_9DEIO